MQILDQGIAGAGIPYSYGFAVILLTILVKLATYPLSKQQVFFTCSTIRYKCGCDSAAADMHMLTPSSLIHRLVSIAHPVLALGIPS